MDDVCMMGMPRGNRLASCMSVTLVVTKVESTFFLCRPLMTLPHPNMNNWLFQHGVLLVNVREATFVSFQTQTMSVTSMSYGW